MFKDLMGTEVKQGDILLRTVGGKLRTYGVNSIDGTYVRLDELHTEQLLPHGGTKYLPVKPTTYVLAHDETKQNTKGGKHGAHCYVRDTSNALIVGGRFGLFAGFDMTASIIERNAETRRVSVQ